MQVSCQRACPQNQGVSHWIEEVKGLSEEETRLLLEGRPVDQLPGEVVSKLEHLGLMEYLEIVPRNLCALFEAYGMESLGRIPQEADSDGKGQQ